MGTEIKKEDQNPYLEIVAKNLNNFIENICCLRETFGYSEGTLFQQQKDADLKYNSFMEQYKTKAEDGTVDYKIPTDKLREQRKLEKRKQRAEKAFELIPPTYIVSLVSIFDSFYAGLVRSIYTMDPDRLKESNMEFHYRDLMEYDTIKEVKVKVIDTTIEDLLRKSHVDQFTGLQNLLKLDTLTQFDGWPDFVELTERRNLFVHSDGVVSSQYISECKKHGSDIGDTEKGSRLVANKEYFDASFKLLYKMSIMLTQILLNKLYVNKYSEDTGERDQLLITNVYDLISEKMYDVAIDISIFAQTKVFKHTAIDNSYIILNLAQAYKWSGDNEKCLSLLKEIDTTTWNNDLLIPKLTLEENYAEVYKKMKVVGSSSSIVSKNSYREWPIFRKIRLEEQFQAAFKEIFGEDLIENHTIKVEKEEIQEVADTITTE